MANKVYAHCKKKYGDNLVVGKFEQDIDLIDGADFKTGLVDDNNGGRNGVYNGSDVNGSIDGTIEKDYRAKAMLAINQVTDSKIENGVEHEGVVFKVELTDQINALGLMVQMLGGASLSGRKFRAKEITYVFQDNSDFLLWFGKAAQLIADTVNVGADLKDQVLASDNTEAAMIPIMAANDER